MMDYEKWMKENGIEDLTGDNEAECQATIEMERYHTIDSDRKAIKAIYRILTILYDEENLWIYPKMQIDLLMHYLKKYLY